MVHNQCLLVYFCCPHLHQKHNTAILATADVKAELILKEKLKLVMQ